MSKCPHALCNNGVSVQGTTPHAWVFGSEGAVGSQLATTKAAIRACEAPFPFHYSLRRPAGH